MRSGKKPRIVGVEEVAIAVRDADRAAKVFEELFGMRFGVEWELPHEGIRVKSERVGDTQIQLVQPTTPESVVAKFIEARGEGLNHIAFKVENLDELVEEIRKKGVVLVPEKPVEVDNPLKKGEKARYIFIHPKSACGVLVELIETW